MNNVTLKRIILISIPFLFAVTAWSQTVKLGTLAPEGSPWHDTMLGLREDWQEASGGKVNIKLYAGGILGDESDMVRKMRIGQLHAAALTAEGLMYIIPEFDVLRMPMLIQNDAELNYVRNELTDYFEELLDKRGYVLLTWSDAGWAYLFTNAPVIYPEDLNKQNQIIFNWAGGSGKRAWMQAGYNSVEISAPDIFMSLQTGLITTVTTTPIVALSYQWFPMVPYITDMKAGPLPGAIIISKKKWQKLPEQLRSQLISTSKARAKSLAKEVTKLEVEAIKVMQENGLKLLSLTDDAREQWQALVQKHMYPEILESEVPEELYLQVVKILADYRSRQSSPDSP